MSIRFQQQHRRLPTAAGDSAWFPEQLNSFIYLNNVSVNGMAVYGEGRTYSEGHPIGRGRRNARKCADRNW
jgi:hypothetical protein